MTLQAGQKIPNVELFVLSDAGPQKTMSDELFGGRKVALFGVPGAFTRTCSARHLPGFIGQAEALKAAGVDEIICLATNDVFVLAAWAQMNDADGKVSMVSDGCLNFTRAAGLEADMSANGFGPRCRRFSMLVDDGVVTHMHLEEPGEFGETSADVLLKDLAS
jgi:peroxiredoxin